MTTTHGCMANRLGTPQVGKMWHRRSAALMVVVAVGCSETWTQTEDCTARGGSVDGRRVSVDRLNVLFVIDDGPSMAQEQALLAREIPRMLNGLLYGADTARTHLRPVGNLRVGVVSSDMGFARADSVAGCSMRGDDAALHHDPSCGSQERPFAWNFQGYHDSAKTLATVSCDAQLGAGGCAVSQPLAAAFKAVKTNEQGFVRDDPRTGPSRLLIVIITDKDDCSVADSRSLGSDGASAVDCADSTVLTAVEDHVAALQATQLAHRVSVAIIAGLPTDLEADATVLTSDSREAHYQRILSDPRMQSSGDQPSTSCLSAAASAAPPRRLVEFARRFGESARVRSICGDDLTVVLGDLLAWVSDGSEWPSCTGSSLVTADPEADCRMTWELPQQFDPELPLTPALCSDRPEFLSVPGPGFPTRTEAGRVLCEVRRAPVTHDTDGSDIVDGEGYYVSDGRGACYLRQREIRLTEAARVPHDVKWRLHCTKSACSAE